MDDDADRPTVSIPIAGATPGVPGWYPDPFSMSLQRWWTGRSWTFSTNDPTAVAAPAPPREVTTLPTPVALPAVSPPRAPAPPKPPRKARTDRSRRPFKGHRVLVAIVVGIIVGLVGARLLYQPKKTTSAADGPTVGEGRTGTSVLPTTPAPLTNTDPSAPALAGLIVRPSDVAAPLSVALVKGGGGLGQATLDLCNATYPSEALRTARLQDAVADAQGDQILSTEAVLYGGPAATAQAFSELKAAASACPSTPVPSPVGEPTVITRFNPPPDGDWPQTPMVSRAAFDFTSTEASGQTTHTVAVYLQRGRVLMGVYFFQPDGKQPVVAGQSTLSGIVGVFAARMAALPASVVGS